MTAIAWLGAHKTGTTYLQRSLDLSTEALERHGVLYTELQEFRDRYTRPLLDEKTDLVADDASFADAGARVRLVFDENIPGYVQHALSRHGFYPNAVARASRVLGHLRVVADQFVFGVRRYDTFLPSLYCETLKSTPFIPFDRYLAKAFLLPGVGRNPVAGPGSATSTDFSRMNWHELVMRLARAFPDARMRVYFHEDLREHEAKLLSSILDVPADEFTMLRSIERVGFSGRAVERLNEINEKRTVELRDVRQEVRRFPSGPEFPIFAPWSDEQRGVLLENYRNHCAMLRDESRVEFIAFREQ